MEVKNSIEKLTLDIEKIQRIQDILQLGYSDIQFIADNIAVCTEYENGDSIESVITLNKNMEIDGVYYTTSVFKKDNTIIATYYDREKDTKSTIVNIDNKEIYRFNYLFSTIINEKLHNLFIAMNSMLPAEKLKLMLVSTEENKVRFIGEIDEPPISAYASSCKIQFLSNNTVFGINEKGNLFKQSRYDWTPVN